MNFRILLNQNEMSALLLEVLKKICWISQEQHQILRQLILGQWSVHCWAQWWRLL